MDKVVYLVSSSQAKVASTGSQLERWGHFFLREKESHISVWPLAIVIQVFPSDDNLVRKVEVKLHRDNKFSTFIRSVVELVPLLLRDEQ